LLSKGFSLSVHHLNFTTEAAQGDLATLPVIVLPMGHHPSSAKELIMAQARAQGTLGYAREMHASDSFSALVVNSFLCAFFAP
jgi:hypothetical protein